jgi:hypothetical protein
MAFLAAILGARGSGNHRSGFCARNTCERGVCLLEWKRLGNLPMRAPKTDGPTGQALSVQVFESEDMETAVKTIAHELSLSGLNGLDFMIDANGVCQRQSNFRPPGRRISGHCCRR